MNQPAWRLRTGGVGFSHCWQYANKRFIGGKSSIKHFFDYYSQSPMESVDVGMLLVIATNLATNYPNQPGRILPAAGRHRDDDKQNS